MKAIVNIAWKDLIVVFRDRGALALLLLAPFALTLAMSAAFGRDGNPGLSDIPLLVVNYDSGEFGDLLIEILNSERLSELISPTVTSDEAAARTAVDQDKAAAVIIIPANLSQRIMPGGPTAGAPATQPAAIELYLNPTRPISAGVIQAIVTEFLHQVNAGAAGGQVAVSQLVMNGLISPEQAPEIGRAIGEAAGRRSTEARLITISRQVDQSGGEANGFDWMGYMAPSMAILFLMFAVMDGGRSILVERDHGTLPRMLTAPVTAAQVLVGKLFGTYLIGLAQMAILIVGSALIFNVRWGSPAGVLLTILSVVAAAAGWGALIAAFARSSGQANAVGTALALVFAIGAGNFIARPALPGWLQTISFISPNAWGLEAFAALTAGGGVSDLLPYLAGMWLMAAVLFTAAAVAFRRQYQ
jgi:ABC-2 type transport system permease protein